MFGSIADLAEGGRFELPAPCGATVFKTAPINRSGTPPQEDGPSMPRKPAARTS